MMVATRMMNKMMTTTMTIMMTKIMTIMMTTMMTLKTTPVKQNKAKGCVPPFESQAWHEPAIKI